MQLLNRPTLIALCEDAAALKIIEQIAAQRFTIVATRSLDRALAVLKTDTSVAALLVDHSSGLDALKQAREIRPQSRRIWVCSPGKLLEIVEGLQSGAVERVVYKPIRAPELAAALPLLETQAKRATA